MSPRHVGRALVPFVLLASIGCARHSAKRPSTAQCPDSSWHASRTPDSLSTFCAPPGWRQISTRRIWTFSSDSAPRYATTDWVIIATVPAGQVVDPQDVWPPSLLGDSGTVYPDGTVADRYVVHWDTVGSGRTVRVETARVTGGFDGERDRPALVATWPIANGDWVLVQGRAANDTTLRLLRRMLSTIRTPGDRVDRMLLPRRIY